MFSLLEIRDIMVMAFAIGFIFKDVFPKRPKVEVILPKSYDPLAHRGFNWSDFWFAVAVVGPSIIFHEFGHKFVALGFGLSATFHAAYTWLAIGLILKLLNFGFIFIVPAFVEITGAGSALQMSAIAFAGPAINLALWLGCAAILRSKKFKKYIRYKHDLYYILFLTKRINMFLFIFNMLPIPMFDGWSVYSNFFHAFF